MTLRLSTAEDFCGAPGETLAFAVVWKIPEQDVKAEIMVDSRFRD
jgi:hypothetical protein